MTSISLAHLSFSLCSSFSFMGAEYYRKSGKIPAFGDWENVNQMPITEYFECARQAGLLRCTCSGKCGGAYFNNAAYWGRAAAVNYGVGYQKPLPRRIYAVPQLKTRGMNKGYPQINGQRKQVQVGELMNIEPRNQAVTHKHPPKESNKSRNLVQQKSSVSAKPVDEDLYKISPELLEQSKRKKMLGFFSKCMVPPCTSLSSSSSSTSL